MKRLILGLLALGSISSFASDYKEINCHKIDLWGEPGHQSVKIIIIDDHSVVQFGAKYPYTVKECTGKDTVTVLNNGDIAISCDSAIGTQIIKKSSDELTLNLTDEFRSMANMMKSPYVCNGF
jgi:hypothetical protein